MAALILMVGTERRRIPLQKDRTVVGRQEGNDLVLTDAWISRQHATFERRGNHYWVLDHQSRYGVYVNGERVVSERGLAPGDTISFGSTSVVFEDISTDAAQAAPMVEAGGPPQSLPQQLERLKRELLATRGQAHEPVGTGPQGKPRAPSSSPEVFARMARLERWVSDMEAAVAALQHSHRTSATLLEFTRVIAFVLDSKMLLNLALDAILQAVRGRAGAVALLEEGRLVPQAMRDNAALQPFQKLAVEVVKSQVPVRAPQDAALCAPVRGTQRVLGAILVARPQGSGGFTQEDLDLLFAMASQVAVAIEKVELHGRVRREERIRDELARYVSVDVADAIVKAGGDLTLGGARTVTTLFCDIKNFTPLSERLSPEQVLHLLQAFYTEMNAAVLAAGGTIDKYIGDCLMAHFGAMIEYPDHPARAVRAALAMRDAVPRVQAAMGPEWAETLGGFNVTIGVNTGPVVAGNVGTEVRKDFTVIGDAVNVASRLQNAAAAGQILVGEITFLACDGQFAMRPLPLLTVKGKSAPVQAYEVLGLS